MLRKLAGRLHRHRRRASRTLPTTASCCPGARLLELYQRLAWTFRAELTSFERKQYVSLSHEANKAMNLNSYIGLMGGTYRDTVTVSGRELVPARPGQGDLEIPEPDYVLTLDADSVLLPEYCLRLVHLMEQSEHADVAVAQTPYSAFPGSGTRLERIAGATTDLQYIAHQGMTYYGATFWVGANAVLRKRALDDIRESTFVGSWEIRRYIQDRTVIEDTESTIDLRRQRLDAAELPGAARLQRHPAGLRLAVHPAPALGQRRPADPAQAVAYPEGAGGARRGQPDQRDRSSGSTTWRRSPGARSACCCCSRTRSTTS